MFILVIRMEIELHYTGDKFWMEEGEDNNRELGKPYGPGSPSQESFELMSRKTETLVSPINIPAGENILTYRLKDRISWARAITDKLALPRNPRQARKRFSSPSGKPFPFKLAPWANFWVIGKTDLKRKRGGQVHHNVDICKLLWMEGYSEEDFPNIRKGK